MRRPGCAGGVIGTDAMDAINAVEGVVLSGDALARQRDLDRSGAGFAERRQAAFEACSRDR